MDSEVKELGAELTSLGQLPVGAHARIAEIQGGRQLTRRLLGLGLRIGMELQVLQRRGRGVVVARGESRIALGGGVAEKIMMTPVAHSQEDREDKVLGRAEYTVAENRAGG